MDTAYGPHHRRAQWDTGIVERELETRVHIAVVAWLKVIVSWLR